VLSSELIDGGSFDESWQAHQRTLMQAKVDGLNPERLA